MNAPFHDRRRTFRLPSSLAECIDINESGCWVWTGAIDTSGYGRFGKRLAAHRAIYETVVGPIPEGMQLDHLCHSNDQKCEGGITCPHRRCVNPAHLEPVTKRENTLRGRSASAVNAAKTSCVAGHPFDEENTRINIRPNGAVWRKCRACGLAWDRKHRSRTASTLEVAA